MTTDTTADPAQAGAEATALAQGATEQAQNMQDDAASDVRGDFVVTADIIHGEQIVRAGRVVVLTAAQAEAYAASIRSATAADRSAWGRAIPYLD